MLYSCTDRSITLETITEPASEPIPVDALLRKHCHIYGTDEDTLLTEYVSTARQLFEHLTGRAILETQFRQSCSTFDRPMQLHKGKTTSIETVVYVNGDGDEVELTDYESDLTGESGLLWCVTYPPVSFTKSPVMYVEFTAGWEDEDAVPNDIKTALRTMVANLYLNRESHTETTLKAVPISFQAIVDKYWIGV